MTRWVREAAEGADRYSRRTALRRGTVLPVASSAVWVAGLLRRLVRNSSWGLASTAIEFVLSLVETTLVARALGAADYGRLALVVASVVSIKQLVDVRAWEGATRYLAEFL